MKAVLFDLDQTLLDRDRSLLNFLRWQCDEMLNDIVDREKFIARFIELDDHGRVWKDKVFGRLVEEFEIGAWTREQLLSVYENNFCVFVTPVDGAMETIESLHKLYRLGIVSNGMTPFQERNFRGLGFGHLFEIIVVSSAVSLRKPDPKIFHLACEELDVRPEEAVFVGDNPDSDIRGAQEAGLKAVFLPTKRFRSCEFADATCEDLRELPRILESL